MTRYLYKSDSEVKVATEVIARYFPSDINAEECVEKLYSIAKKLVAGELQLDDLNLKKSYPEDNQEITSNLLSEIAAILARRFSDDARRGAVNTPYQLAYDMASLSLASKLHHEVGLSIDEAYEQIKARSLDENQLAVIKKYSWLDPCIGTGVFALAVFNLLKDLGISFEISDFHFTGFDTDPIAIASSQIRLAMDFCHSNKISFEECLTLFKEKILVANTLSINGLQNNILGDRSREVSIVIGNPPYVKANRLDAKTKSVLNKQFPGIYTGSTDLYVYFIASAISVLESQGIVCFVSPAHFLKSKYGRKIREFIKDNASLDMFLDFNELEVFEGISSHICVYVLSNVSNAGTFAYLFDVLNRNDYLLEGIAGSSVVHRENINADGWNMHTYNVAEVFQQLFSTCVPLKRVVGNIYSGLKTGRQAVYVIGENLALDLMNDPKSKKFIKNYLPPKKIRRWQSPAVKEYIIVIKKDDTVPEDSLLMEYLAKHKESLLSRDDLSGQSNWYALRDCSYYDLFEKPKIVYPDISATSRFSLDLDGRYITDGAFFLPTDSPYLLGVLNSSLANFYFKLRLSGIGTVGNGGRIRFKKVYVDSFPVPVETEENESLRKAIAVLVEELDDQTNEINQHKLDELVYNLYNVTPEIRALVEEKIKI